MTVRNSVLIADVAAVVLAVGVAVVVHRAHSKEFGHRAVVPSVWFPKPGAIPSLRPFRLFDSSFESSWRLKSFSTSLNIQIGVVLEK